MLVEKFTKSPISEDEFLQKIENEDGNFRNFHFSFRVNLSDSVVHFPLDFTGSIFEQKVNLSDSIFYEKVDFAHCSFEKFYKAKRSTFKKDWEFNNATFHEDFNIHKSIIEKDFFFIGTTVMKIADFTYCRFKGNGFFVKSRFYATANFSYVFFYKDKQFSFVSINKNYEFGNDIYKTPFLIFRAVDFYENIEFRDVDLSRSVFQDSTFEDKVYFKECTFAQNKGRDCFYDEIAREENFLLKRRYFDYFLKQKVIFFIIPVGSNKAIGKLNLSDRIFFKNKRLHMSEWKRYFILAKDEVDNFEEKKKYLFKKYAGYDFNQTFLLLDELEKDFIECQRKEGIYDSSEKIKYYVFKLKQFKEVKLWENIEFLSRQMKRNLAGSTNWQKSGDFYIGEMRAKAKKLKLLKEDFFYIQFLKFYDLISGFGERTWKVVLTIIMSFVFIYFVIEFFKPELRFYESITYIANLFVPVLGDKGFSEIDLAWGPKGSVFFMGAIVWFYILWFLLILSIQRKFKK